MKKAFALLFLITLMATSQAVAQCPPGTYGVYTVSQVQFNTGLPAINDTVSLPGLVITGLAYNGFWAQDGGVPTSTPWSGIFCYLNGPPTGLSPGDSVDVMGVYQEYFTLSEIRIDGGRGCVVPVGTGTIPAPAVIPTCSVNDSIGNTVAEQWEGVLVMTESLIVTNTDPLLGHGFWESKPFKAVPCGPYDTLTCDDAALATVGVPPLGDTLLSITGVSSFSWNMYRLEPRDNNDIVFKNTPPAPNVLYIYPTDDTHIVVVFDRALEATSATNTANYVNSTFDITVSAATLEPVDKMEVTLTVSDMSSFQDTLTTRDLTISNIANEYGTVMPVPATELFAPGVKTCEIIQTNVVPATDSTVFGFVNLAVAGIVSAAPSEAWGNDDMFIQDAAGLGSGFGYGLYIDLGNYVPPAIARGDSVVIGGLCRDFFGNTQMSIVNNITVVSSGNPVPTPVTVSAVAALTEAYEGKLVRVNDLRVSNANPDAPNNYGEFEVTDLAGTGTPFRVDDMFSPGIDPEYSVYTVGDGLTYLSGPMYYSFGNRKLEPRDTLDVEVLGYVGVDDAAGVPGVVTQLGENTPNPFNPTTTIEFSVGTKGHARLDIFDVSGRKIRSLVNEQLEVGGYTARWDGRNDAGQEVASGIYFYRLDTEAYQSTRKMVLVR